jgi:hypothetical protein
MCNKLLWTFRELFQDEWKYQGKSRDSISFIALLRCIDPPERDPNVQISVCNHVPTSNILETKSAVRYLLRSIELERQANSIMVFLLARANAELVPKFHVSLHASHAALPKVTQKISP